MIKLENTEVVGWEAAIRGMRNPKNSWDRSDSGWDVAPPEENVFVEMDGDGYQWTIGPNDQKLMKQLAKGGPVHAKYRRMIVVYVDITAPLYWWKEFDTYKVGTVANSCSTMHKIADKEFTREDFSCEHLMKIHEQETMYHSNEMYLCDYSNLMDVTIEALNIARTNYLETKDKKFWWQMIQLLPSSYNQKRTVMMNYEVLTGIYEHRRDHKLDEWRDLCAWIEGLPFSEIITGKEEENA